MGRLPREQSSVNFPFGKEPFLREYCFRPKVFLYLHKALTLAQETMPAGGCLAKRGGARSRP